MIMADLALGLDEVSVRTRQSRLKDRIAKCKANTRKDNCGVLKKGAQMVSTAD